MPHNFHRPAIPYSNKSLQNDDRYKTITNPLKAPVGTSDLDGDFNYVIDSLNILDQDIINVTAGAIPGSSTPTNIDHLVTTDGAGNISWIKIRGINVQDFSLPGTKIINSSITALQIADGSLTSGKYAPESISEDALQDGAASRNKIPDLAINTDKLDNEAVTAAKTAKKTMTAAEIADHTITALQISPQAITQNELANSSVTLQKLAQEVLNCLIPIGTIIQFAGTTGTPASFLECAGQAVSRSTYATLFANIGTTYGNGDGSTTFNVPDMRGVTSVGISSSGSTNNKITTATAPSVALGAAFGSERHQLSINEIPSHTHTINVVLNGGSSGQVNVDQTGASASPVSTNSTGGGQLHNNVQPSIFQRFYIRAL